MARSWASIVRGKEVVEGPPAPPVQGVPVKVTVKEPLGPLVRDWAAELAFEERQQKLNVAEDAANERLHKAVAAERCAAEALVRARSQQWDENSPCPKEQAHLKAAKDETKAAAAAAVAATKAVVDHKYAYHYPSVFKWQ